MIQFKLQPEIPDTLRSKKVKRAALKLRSLVANRRYLDVVFEPLWRADDIKHALYLLQNGKCCYCERPRDTKREFDIDHFRPKGRVHEDPKHPGYWWLAYEWTNLLYSCKRCNSDYKQDHFPLLNRFRAYNSRHKIALCKPVLFNPRYENPDEFLDYHVIHELKEVIVKGKDYSKRGEITVKILGLNENDLPYRRFCWFLPLEHLANLMEAKIAKGNKDHIEKVASEIREATMAKTEFAGFRRWFFRSRKLGKYVSDD